MKKIFAPAHGALAFKIHADRRLAGLRLLALVLFLAGGPNSHAQIYTLGFADGIQGTALNSNSIIASASGAATAVSLTTGTQTALGGIPSGTVDAGQYDNDSTLYLTSAGGVSLVQNSSGVTLQNYSATGSSTISRAVNLGGTLYAFVASATNGVHSLNLSNNSLAAIAGAWNVSNLQGLDVFPRPNASTVNDVIVGILRTKSGNFINIYTNGALAQVVTVSTAYGSARDFSFDVSGGRIWVGTQANSLFAMPFDFSPYGAATTVAVGRANAMIQVTWQGSALQSSTNLIFWQTVSNAAQPYLTPPTNNARFFRAVQ